MKKYYIVKCNKCGKWQSIQTSNPERYIFKCKYCNNRTKLKHKGEFGYHLITRGNINNGKTAELQVKYLNNKQYKDL